MNTTFLEPQEIHTLTKKTRYRAQAHALRAMQIHHKVRPDGSIAILRSHLVNVFGGEPAGNTSRAKKETGPNWAAI